MTDTGEALLMALTGRRIFASPAVRSRRGHPVRRGGWQASMYKYASPRPKNALICAEGAGWHGGSGLMTPSGPVACGPGRVRSVANPAASKPALHSSLALSSIRAVVAVIITAAPSSASILAAAKPMPSGLPAPVTTTTRPDRSNAAGHCPILIGPDSRCCVPHKPAILPGTRRSPQVKQQASQLCTALLKPTAGQLTGTTRGEIRSFGCSPHGLP